MATRTSTRKSARGEYIETDTHNRISRRSKIEGTPHIILGGRVVVQADACLRGDLVRPASDASEVKENTRTSITVGKCTLIATGAVLHPPHRVLLSGELSYYPMKIGENCYVGPGAFVAAASMGSYVHVGAGAVIGSGCMIRDCVKILEGAVLVPGMVVPPGVVVGGRPARILEDLPDGWGLGLVDSQAGEWVEGGDLRELIRGIR